MVGSVDIPATPCIQDIAEPRSKYFQLMNSKYERLMQPTHPLQYLVGNPALLLRSQGQRVSAFWKGHPLMRHAVDGLM